MGIKVSVVIAVYNPGLNMDRLMASLDAQSLPANELELIFVDDGSTDGTPDRLRAFSASRPNVIVRAIPNSGWPGRPRNIGIDLARGEYVFFADHDDELFPEALERMRDLATANGSDIVYGKVVGVGRHTPFWPLAKRTVGRADIIGDGLLLSHTVHKLFRRQFLLEHRIRFPEGPVRLEDHYFMAQAIPLASVISVLADYPCYGWVQRKDGTNNSSDEVYFPGYWEYLGESLDLFTERAGQGPVNDASRAWAGQRMMMYARPRQYLPLGPAERDHLLTPLEDAVRSYLPEHLDAMVPVLKRLRLQALRTRDRATFDRLQTLTGALTFPVGLDLVRWSDGVLLLAASSTVAGAAGTEVVVTKVGSDLVLVLDEIDPDASASARTLLTADAGTLELTVRHRSSGVEWPLHGTEQSVAAPLAEGLSLGVRWEGAVDVWNGAFGAALDDGIWDVLARVQFLGESFTLRLPLTQELPAAEWSATTPERRAVAYRTAMSTLAIKISPVHVAATRPRVVEASWHEAVLHLRLDPPVIEPAVVVARLRGRQAGTETPVIGGRASLALGPLGPGQIVDLSLRTGPKGASQEQRLVYAMTDVVQRSPYFIYETAHGSLSVRHLKTPSVRRPELDQAPRHRPATGWRLVVRGLSHLRRLGR